jgi:NADH dehydrogenase FAD-containing subunit
MVFFQVTAGSVVLPGRPKSVSNTAEKQLRNLGIDLKLNTKATDQTELPDGRTELTLTGPSGEPTKLVVDLYIPTSGVIPNSSFLPPKMLNPAGFVKVGHKLDVPGAEGVFAIGEVSAVEPAQYVHLERQAGHMAKSLLQLLSGNGPLPYKASTKRM